MALKLGYSSRRAMYRDMTAADLCEWEALRTLEPVAGEYFILDAFLGGGRNDAPRQQTIPEMKDKVAAIKRALAKKRERSAKVPTPTS